MQEEASLKPLHLIGQNDKTAIISNICINEIRIIAAIACQFRFQQCKTQLNLYYTMAWFHTQGLTKAGTVP